MGAALPLIAVGAQVAGKVVGGIGQRAELRAAAKVDDANAQLALASGEDDVLQIRRDERAQAGDALAMLAGSGGLIGQGSAADIIADSAYQRELDILNVRKKAYGEFRNNRQAAKDKRKAGRNALIGGVFGAVSTALSGAADMRAGRLAAAQGAKARSARSGG